MQTLYPPNDKDAPGDGDDDVLSQELKNNFNAVRSLLATSNEKEAQTMATKTAVAAEEEIRRLQNGIAELEALLAQQQHEEQPPPVVAFPSLPPVVVEEEEEEAPGKGKLVRS
jgi:hypothetical protein